MKTYSVLLISYIKFCKKRTLLLHNASQKSKIVKHIFQVFELKLLSRSVLVIENDNEDIDTDGSDTPHYSSAVISSLSQFRNFGFNDQPNGCTI